MLIAQSASVTPTPDNSPAGRNSPTWEVHSPGDSLDSSEALILTLGWREPVLLSSADAAALGRALVAVTYLPTQELKHVGVFTAPGQVILVDLTDPQTPTIAARIDVQATGPWTRSRTPEETPL